MKYKHIFFDLDHTLWDYDANASASLRELSLHYELDILKGFQIESLIKAFFEVNYELWDLYNAHQIQRKDIRLRRFPMIFKRMGFESSQVPSDLEDRYVALCPTKPNTFPHAHDILDYLSERYKLHIITNGFNGIQETKLKSCGLHHHFDVVVTSETASQRKPSPDIFHLAMERAGASLKESIMIGDNLNSDIKGAQSVGMDHVWFNPTRFATSITVQHEIENLLELKTIL